MTQRPLCFIERPVMVMMIRVRTGHCVRIRGERRASSSLLSVVVFDGGAIHDSCVGGVIPWTTAMQGSAVIPHHHVTRLPRVSIDELFLRAMGEQIFDRRKTRGFVHAFNGFRMGRDVNALFTSQRIRLYQWSSLWR